MFSILSGIYERGEFDDTALLMIRDCDMLFRCSNCGRLVWERVDASNPGVDYFVQVDPVPRIWVDPDDRDGLGRIRLRHPQTIAEMGAARLPSAPGVQIVAYWNGGELRGRLRYAVDAAGGPIPGEWSLEGGI